MRPVSQETWNPQIEARSKARQLRDMRESPEPEFLMEAHNDLFANTGEAASPACTVDHIAGKFL